MKENDILHTYIRINYFQNKLVRKTVNLPMLIIDIDGSWT